MNIVCIIGFREIYIFVLKNQTPTHCARVCKICYRTTSNHVHLIVRIGFLVYSVTNMSCILYFQHLRTCISNMRIRSNNINVAPDLKSLLESYAQTSSAYIYNNNVAPPPQFASETR